MTLYSYYCYEGIVFHDIIFKRQAQIMGKRIFTVAHLCNGISAVDLYIIS